MKSISALIRMYQNFLSPVFGACCRFHPSCSEYVRGAIQNRGFLIGSALGVWRLLRCQPFSRGGWDPVPCEERRPS